MKSQFNKYRRLLERKNNLEQKRKDHCSIIDNFYAEDIIQIENAEQPILGKEKLKALELKNMEGVLSVDTQIKNVVMDEKTGLVWGEMIIRFESKNTGKKRLEEAFFQKWVEGKIHYQRFFYNSMIKED